MVNKTKVLELCEVMDEKIDASLLMDKDLMCVLEVSNFVVELRNLINEDERDNDGWIKSVDKLPKAPIGCSKYSLIGVYVYVECGSVVEAEYSQCREVFISAHNGEEIFGVISWQYFSPPQPPINGGKR